MAFTPLNNIGDALPAETGTTTIAAATTLLPSSTLPAFASSIPTATGGGIIAIPANQLDNPDACAAALIAHCPAAHRSNFVKIKVHDNKPAVVGLGVVLGLVLLAILVYAVWVRLVYLPRHEAETRARIEVAVRRALISRPGARWTEFDGPSMGTLRGADGATLVGCVSRETKGSGSSFGSRARSPLQSDPVAFDDDDDISIVPTRSYRYPSPMP